MKIERFEGFLAVVLTTVGYKILMEGHLPKDALKAQLVVIGGSGLLQLPFSQQGKKGKWLLRALPFIIIGAGSYFGKVPKKVAAIATPFFGVGHLLIGEGIRCKTQPPRRKKERLEFEAVKKRVMEQSEAPTEDELEAILREYPGGDEVFELKLVNNFNTISEYSEEALELAEDVPLKFVFENKVKLRYLVDLYRENDECTSQFCEFLDENIEQVTLGMFQFFFHEERYRVHTGLQALFLKHFKHCEHWDEEIAKNYVTVAKSIGPQFPIKLAREFALHFANNLRKITLQSFRKYYVAGRQFGANLFNLVNEESRHYFRFLGIQLDESGYVGPESAEAAIGNPKKKDQACVEVAKELGYAKVDPIAVIFVRQLLNLIDGRKKWVEAFQEVGSRFKEDEKSLNQWIEDRRKKDQDLPEKEKLMNFKKKAPRSRSSRSRLISLKMRQHTSLGSFSLGKSSAELLGNLSNNNEASSSSPSEGDSWSSSSGDDIFVF